jgi:biotin carboxyl carrier protein
MGAAKPISLSVKPHQVTHLCFEVDGILEASTPKAELGATAPVFDFAAFYAKLGAVPTVTSDPSRLLYNFLEIDSAVATYALAALRREDRKVALAKAINTRQNAYYAKYGNAAAIISQIKSSYSPSITGSKMQRLDVLTGIADQQWKLLMDAYSADKRTGVVRKTESTLSGKTNISGSSTTKGTDQTDGRTAETIAEAVGLKSTGNNFPNNPPPDGKTFSWQLNAGSYNEELIQSTSGQTTTTKDKTTSSGTEKESETIYNTDYTYRTPYYEGAAQYERAKISLIDQYFTQFMATQNLPNLARVFQNELNNIDGDVYRLQIAYLNTILMSPIAGTVTAVYKRPGDAVRAGEPVLRIEDSSTIYIAGTVLYRGPIALDSIVEIQTKLFDLSPLATPLPGVVVSVRGHRDDDTWDLVIRCNNLDSAKKPIFPLGYRFDYDDTHVTII